MSVKAEPAACSAAASAVPLPGALVRTLKPCSDGVHRAEVRRVFDRDGVRFAEVGGRDYAVSELEVIRQPLG